MPESSVDISLTPDEALVLCAFFHRFDETDRLEFAHVAEWIALEGIAGQLERSVAEIFLPNWFELLAAAQARVADGFEGTYPGPKIDGADV